MTKEEYDNNIEILELKLNAEKRLLSYNYALKNRKYRHGDIVFDGTETILVDEIKWGFGWEYPESIYHGVRLKKNLEPFKSGERGSMYQTNIEKQLK